MGMLKRLLAIFLEGGCSLCDRPASGGVLCSHCDRQLQGSKFSNPKQFWQAEIPLFVWGNYGGSLKRAIATMKYGQQPQLGAWLGTQLGHSWHHYFPHQALAVLPIPMHPDKQRERGYNQAELISRQFAQVTRTYHAPQILLRQKATRALFELNLQQRQQEIDNAFVLAPQGKRLLGDRPVLLVDDIYTTGTTAQAAYKTLQKNGISVIGIAAIATSRGTHQSQGLKAVPSRPRRPEPE